MLTKIVSALALSGALWVAGDAGSRTVGCCFAGSDCCNPAQECCVFGACSTAAQDCCGPTSPCCETGESCCVN